jgi:hypothetical protein
MFLWYFGKPLGGLMDPKRDLIGNFRTVAGVCNSKPAV